MIDHDRLAAATRWYEELAGTPEVCNDVVAWAIVHQGADGRAGHVVVDGWERPVWHCWIVAPDGSIVDPTVHQFDGRAVTYPEGDRYVVRWEVEDVTR